MTRASLASLIVLCFSPLAYASAAHATTPGCNTTDPDCASYDPCTYDYPAPGYECGTQENNATSNGTFIVPAADLGFTWNIPEAWSPDSFTELPFDCGVNFSYDGGAYPPPGCSHVISFGGERPQEFLELMPDFGSYQSSDPIPSEYFSYSFAWWIDGRADITAEELSRDFVSYYQGLMVWCDPTFGALPTCNLDGFKAHFVEVAAGPDNSKSFTGEVQLYDEFYTGNLITLNFVVNTYYCGESQHQASLFSASPQPRPGEAGSTKASEAVWAQLLGRQAAFTCE